MASFLAELSTSIFGPPDYKARADSLNAQWYALNQTVDGYQLTSASGGWFSQFYADYYAWGQFYEKQSSFWSSDNDVKSLDDWTTKLQEYTKQASQFAGSSDAGYIPTVKDPPAEDSESLIDKAANAAAKAGKGLEDTVLKLGIGAGVLIVILLVIAVYGLTHAKVSTPAVKVG